MGGGQQGEEVLGEEVMPVTKNRAGTYLSEFIFPLTQWEAGKEMTH